MSKDEIKALIKRQGYQPTFKRHKGAMDVYASFVYLGKLSKIEEISEEALIALIDSKFSKEAPCESL